MNRDLLVPAALALLGAALSLAGCDSHGAQRAEAPPRPVYVTTAHPHPEAETQTLAGVVRARVESDLGFRVPGKVTRRLVDVGQVVRAGDPLAELDPLDLTLQLQQARAELAAATTARDTASSELRRVAALHGAGWSTGSDYDRQRATADEARARQDRAIEAVTLAEHARDYATLRADAAGVTTATRAEPGQVVTAGEMVVRLARLDQREAAVAVPEALLEAARHGHASVTLWALPGQTFAANLRELSPVADPATRTYAARFSLPGATGDVALGMTATVTLAAAAAPVTHLPITAILDEGDGPTVWVVDARTGAVARRPVTLARVTDADAVIATGLADGEIVVALGVQKLRAAERVRPVTSLRS